MKHFYHNKRLAKRLAGGLQPTVKKLGEICGKKISTQDVYAATLGFENWDGFVESPTPDIKSCPHSTLHWENNFSLHLLRKWDEECEASYSQAIHQLVADLQKSNPQRGGDDFEGIAYEENNPLFSSQAFSAKLQECLETKTPPAIKAQDHSLRFDTRTHDSAGRAINPQAYILAVGPNPQARAYQQQVIYFARECFRHIGRKQARASKQWSLEFAYDIYAEALRREFFFWNKGWSNPLLFSEFYAKELGYIDFDNYQKEQKTSATCNYDSRADKELPPEARELRQKLREGYLFRYLSTLDLQPEHQIMAFQELCSVLKTNHSLYNLTIAQQSESLHWAHISALPASGSIIRLMDRIEAAKKGADILSDDEYADLIDVCTDPSNGYQGTVLPALRPLCHRWAGGSDVEKKRAYDLLELLSICEGGEWTLWFVQLLLSGQPDEKITARANSLLLKIHKEAEAGVKRFTDKNLLSTYVDLFREQLLDSKKHKNLVLTLQSSMVLVKDADDLLRTDVIEQKLFANDGEGGDSSAYQAFVNSLPDDAKAALHLGFLPRKLLPAQLQKKGGAA